VSARNYWIGVVPKADAEAMIGGRYAELNRGRAGPLERMREGDGLALYSPRSGDADDARVQAFTAIGRVADGPIVQTHAHDASATFRRGVDYLPASEAPIKPLIEPLSFIRSKLHWGAPFRFGFIRVPESDFAQIAAAMGCDFERCFPRSSVKTPPRESSALPA
jgi:EVE domain-containing protein